MPTTRKYKKRTTRPRTARRRRTRRTTVMRTPGLNPVADQQRIVFRYMDNKALTSGASSATHKFRGNSLFDPDWSGAGGQPFGYDQWSAFYKKYMVYGMKWKLTFINESALNQVLCVVLPKNESNNIASMNLAKERPFSKNVTLGVEGSGKNIRTLSGYMSTKKIFGLPKLTQGDLDYSALTSTDPLLPWFLHIYTQATDRASSATTRIEIELTYYSRMFSHEPLPAS